MDRDEYVDPYPLGKLVPEREPPAARHIGILIQCACGNRLELNPDLSHGATDEWSLVTKIETWICGQCGRYINVELPSNEQCAVDLRGFGKEGGVNDANNRKR